MSKPNTATYVNDAEDFRARIAKEVGLDPENMLGYILIVPTDIDNIPAIVRCSQPDIELIKSTLAAVYAQLCNETVVVSASDQQERHNGRS